MTEFGHKLRVKVFGSGPHTDPTQLHRELGQPCPGDMFLNKPLSKSLDGTCFSSILSTSCFEWQKSGQIFNRLQYDLHNIKHLLTYRPLHWSSLLFSVYLHRFVSMKILFSESHLESKLGRLKKKQRQRIIGMNQLSFHISRSNCWSQNCV